MEINFRHEINGQKVITAIAQDWKTGQILMVANMNKDALQKTIETGKAHYWSTSRNSQWLKGESSGHTQEVKEILVDCDMAVSYTHLDVYKRQNQYCAATIQRLIIK